MHQPCLVRRLQAATGAHVRGEDLAPVAPVLPAAQRHALHVLHREVHAVAVGSDLVDHDDVLVGELGHALRLAEEPLARRLVRVAVGMQDLDGDVTTEDGVAREQDDPHAAGAEPRDDPVAPDVVRDRDRAGALDGRPGADRRRDGVARVRLHGLVQRAIARVIRGRHDLRPRECRTPSPERAAGKLWQDRAKASAVELADDVLGPDRDRARGGRRRIGGMTALRDRRRRRRAALRAGTVGLVGGHASETSVAGARSIQCDCCDTSSRYTADPEPAGARRQRYDAPKPPPCTPQVASPASSKRSGHPI